MSMFAWAKLMCPVAGSMTRKVGCGARGGVEVRSNSIAVGMGFEPTSGVHAPARTVASSGSQGRRGMGLR
jgi:hypothetical protein